jgi:hypothetical protein
MKKYPQLSFFRRCLKDITFLRITDFIDCSGLSFAFPKIDMADFLNIFKFSAALSFRIHALSSLKTTSSDQCN